MEGLLYIVMNKYNISYQGFGLMRFEIEVLMCINRCEALQMPKMSFQSIQKKSLTATHEDTWLTDCGI